jgi:CHAD domain-containing protein
MATAKEVEGLDCAAETLEGVRLVLRARFGEMYDLRAAALNREDSEGVHDMRVASRRLRSALKDFADFTGGKGVAQKRLREVAGVLGEVRDEDVAIAALEKVRAQAGAEVLAGIAQLMDERSARRESAREKLKDILAETPLAELQQKFLARLDRHVATGKNAGKRRRATRAGSFRQTGREVVMARLAGLQELSDSLHHPFDVGPLHRMRIAAKRLRYAMELFAPCWGGRLSTYAREVSEMQTALGELHDCDIWIEELGARLDRQRDEAAPETASQVQLRKAAVWLLHHFTKERGKHFRRALTRRDKWETTGFYERLVALLDEAPTTKPDSTGAEPTA